MCACSDKVERVPVHLVYEQPVGLNMAFPVTCPFPMKRVVAIGYWKFFFFGKHRNNLIKFDKMLSLALDPFVVALERI